MSDKDIPVHLTDVYYEDESKKDKLIFKFSDKKYNEILDVQIDTNVKKVNISQDLLEKIGLDINIQEYYISEKVDDLSEILNKRETIFVHQVIFLYKFSCKVKINGKVAEGFKNCIFTKEFNDNPSLGGKIYPLLFCNNIISRSMENNIFLGNVYFIRFIINSRLCFKKSVFNKGLSITLSEIKEKVDFTYCRFNQVNFNNTEFDEKVEFNHSKFEGDVSFNNTKFNKTVDFYRVTFHKPTNFYKTDFNHTVAMTCTTFKEPVIFQYANVAKNLILRKTNFEKDVNLAYINILGDGYLETFGINVGKDAKGFKALNSDKLDWDKNLKNKWGERANDNSCVISNKDAQETYRILKKESIKQTDTINAVDLYKKECEHHYQSLSWWKPKEFFNKLILCFERNVSDYGTNAFRALVMFLILNYAFFRDVQNSIIIFLVISMLCCTVLNLFRTIFALLINIKKIRLVSKALNNIWGGMTIFLRIIFTFTSRNIYIFVLLIVMILGVCSLSDADVERNSIVLDIILNIEGFFRYVFNWFARAQDNTNYVINTSVLVHLYNQVNDLINLILNSVDERFNFNGFIHSINPLVNSSLGIEMSIKSFFQTIVNIILIYEIQKSFRKYSRKL